MNRATAAQLLWIVLLAACAETHERDPIDAGGIDLSAMDAGTDLATPDAEVADPAFELLALTHHADTLQVDSILGGTVTTLFTLPRRDSRRYELVVLDGGRYAVVNYWEHREWIDFDGEDMGSAEPRDVTVLDLATRESRSIDVVAAALSASSADASAHLLSYPWRFRRDRAAIIVGIDRDLEASVLDYVHIDLDSGVATLLELPPDQICWPQEQPSLSPRMPMRCAPPLGSTRSYVVDLDDNSYEEELGLDANEQLLAFVGADESKRLTATNYDELRVRSPSGSVLQELDASSGGYLVGLVESRYLRVLSRESTGLGFWLWDTTTGDRIDVQHCDELGVVGAHAFLGWSPSGEFTALVSCDDDQLLVRRRNEVVASYAWPLNVIADRAFDASSRRLLVAMNVETRWEESAQVHVQHVGSYQYLDLQNLAMHEVPRPNLPDDTMLSWRFSSESYRSADE